MVAALLGIIALVVLMVAGYAVHSPIGWLGSFSNISVPTGLRAERDHSRRT